MFHPIAEMRSVSKNANWTLSFDMPQNDIPWKKLFPPFAPPSTQRKMMPLYIIHTVPQTTYIDQISWRHIRVNQVLPTDGETNSESILIMFCFEKKVKKEYTPQASWNGQVLFGNDYLILPTNNCKSLVKDG